MTDSAPVITSREYVALLAGAVQTVVDEAGESDTARPRVIQGAPTPDALEALLRRVRRQPSNPRAHRILGIALLRAGNCREAVRHLQIAVNLLLEQASRTGYVYGTFCARLELALLLPVVIPLCLQLGRRETVRTLVRKILVTW